MKLLRIGLAVLLTVAMLHIARSNSKGQPEFYTYTDNGITFEMTSVPKALEHTDATIAISVSGLPDSACGMVFRHTEKNPHPVEYESTAMLRDSVAGGTTFFSTVISAKTKGGKLWYYFEAVDSTGTALAGFADFAETNSPPGDSPFLFKYIGEVPSAVLILHIIFIFATVFFLSLATVYAIRPARTGESVRPMAVLLFIATVMCFLGCYPFGIPMNWYAFGVTWEGVPFGHDATDNKTQLLFVYLLFATLAALGSLTRGKIGSDILAPRALGWVGISTFAVMLFIYLIPHSIQFTPTFTYAFCYTWIGVVALLYAVGLLRSRAR